MVVRAGSQQHPPTHRPRAFSTPRHRTDRRSQLSSLGVGCLRLRPRALRSGCLRPHTLDDSCLYPPLDANELALVCFFGAVGLDSLPAFIERGRFLECVAGSFALRTQLAQSLFLVCRILAPPRNHGLEAHGVLGRHGRNRRIRAVTRHFRLRFLARREKPLCYGPNADALGLRRCRCGGPMGLQLTSRTISSFANSWGFCIWQRVRTSENGCERNEASRHRHVARKGNFVTQLSKFDLELTSRTFSSFSSEEIHLCDKASRCRHDLSTVSWCILAKRKLRLTAVSPRAGPSRAGAKRKHLLTSVSFRAARGQAV